MGDKSISPIPDMPKPLTKEERLEREYRRACREKKISRTKAGVMRNQILRSYEILDGIRFDYLSDTAFREKIVNAKRSLESAIGDFLLSDKHWEERVAEFYKMGLEGYKKWKNQPTVQQGPINK